MHEKNPRILHRIYFDNFAPFHDPFEHYLESWAREMPDYKVMKWNMSNLDVHENEWTTTAYRAGAPVFLSEYFRWKVLHTYGGVYLDADCEVLNGKVLHRLIEELYTTDDYDVFFGVEERSNGHPTAQTVGARKGAALVDFMMRLYQTSLAELWPWREKRGLIGPQLMSLHFLKQNINVPDDGFFKNLEEPVVAGRAKVYPQTYFSPKFTILGDSLDFQEGKTCVYHMFANSNVDFSGKKRLKQARDRALTFAEYSSALSKQADFPRQFDPSWFSSRIGQHVDDGIRAENADGTVLYGPYTSLPKGSFIAKVYCSDISDTGTADIAVTRDLGRSVLAKRTVLLPLGPDRVVASPMFVSDGTSNDIEVVLNVSGVERIQISSVEFDVCTEQPISSVEKSSLKILHRIYFGFDGKPDQFQAYLKTWHEHLPDYRIMHWNASNLPMDINPYVRKLHQERDHAFLTDFFRWYVLREFGGVYLDADVELVNGKVFDGLIDELEASETYDAFIGIDERDGGWYTAHSMASKPQSDLSRFMCDLYENFGSFTAWRKKGFYFWAPQLVGLYFTNRGHHKDGMGTTPRLNEPTVVSSVKIYPQDWFSPLAPSANPQEMFSLNGLTENTCLCHHFACSWHDADSKYLQHSLSSGGQTNILVKDLVARSNSLRVFSASSLSTAVGLKRSEKIQTNHAPGYLVYGPYITLGAGRHRLRYELEDVVDVGAAAIDVVANLGELTLLAPHELPLVEGNAFSVDLHLTEPHHAIEFRMSVDETARFSVSRVSVERYDDAIDIHQPIQRP